MKVFFILFFSYRVISLVPSITEIIYLLDAEDSLLANTVYCNYPEEAQRKPKIGDLLHPDYEKILKFKPDFVLITLPMQEIVKRNLEKLNIKWLSFSPESVNEIYVTIDSLGKLLGKPDRAEFLIDSLKNELKTLKKVKISPAVYIELSRKPIYTCGRRSFINEVISLAGGTNIFGDYNVSYFTPSQEEIIKKSPDIIILSYPGARKEDIAERVGWSKINAVRKGHIYIINQDLLARPGPRIFTAIKILNNIFTQYAPEHTP